ncbi:hypothetical protein PO909_029373 [Leuciscus waleckii]
MTAILRVILGPDSCQRLVFPSGLPSTVTELETEIKTQCKIKQSFRLQFMDSLFANDFMNLTSVEEVQDKATVKGDHCADVDSPTTHNDDSFGSSDDSTIILSSSQSTSSRSSWPDFFYVPRFSYDAELKLEQAHAAFREKGTLLIPDPKLKSDILDELIQAIVQHKVYVTDREFDQVAEALIKKHPRLQERGSATGYGGWKTSLKYKLSNYRTHLRKIGGPKVCVNALKHKPDGKRSPAFDVKKPKRGEVAYYPSFPLGECEVPGDDEG